MGAGTDAGIVAITPVPQIMPALRARPCVVGDFVGYSPNRAASSAVASYSAAARSSSAGTICPGDAAPRISFRARWSVGTATNDPRPDRARAAVRSATPRHFVRAAHRSGRTNRAGTDAARPPAPRSPG